MSSQVLFNPEYLKSFSTCGSKWNYNECHRWTFLYCYNDVLLLWKTESFSFTLMLVLQFQCVATVIKQKQDQRHQFLCKYALVYQNDTKNSYRNCSIKHVLAHIQGFWRGGAENGSLNFSLCIGARSRKAVVCLDHERKRRCWFLESLKTAFMS